MNKNNKRARCFVCKQTNTQRKQRDRQTDKQTNKQTNKQTDRQTDKQNGKPVVLTQTKP